MWHRSSYYSGTLPGVKSGTILGHEGVGVVEEIGSEVKQFNTGDRVIVPSTISCGNCEYCLKGITAQCDNANPYGANAGTAFYGGPVQAGPFNGMQSEKVRVPFADSSLIKLPDEISDDQAILLSDILPTAYMAVKMTDPNPDDTVAVFGCGPVGQLAIACLKNMGVNTIFAIDHIPFRLAFAQNQGAVTINFDEVDPVKELLKLTNKKGPTKVIDAVGTDAIHPRLHILQSILNFFKKNNFKEELKEIAPKINPHNGNWEPGNAPSQVLQWAVECVAKAGIVSIIGVYTPLMRFFPIGAAMNKNLTIRMGNCNHHTYIPLLLDWVKVGMFDPLPFITQKLPFEQAIEAYKQFDLRKDGWLKVSLYF